MPEECLRFGINLIIGTSESSNEGSFDVVVEGNAGTCVAQLELQTIWRVKEAANGFWLVLPAPRRVRNIVHEWPSLSSNDQCSGAVLTPARLFEASLWIGLHLQVFVVLSSARLPGTQRFRDCELHGKWIHGAAHRVQKTWRIYRRWRLDTDIVDIIGSFSLSVRRRGLRTIDVASLADEAEGNVDPMLLRLAFIFSACASTSYGLHEEGQSSASPFPRITMAKAQQPKEQSGIFRWLGMRAATFVVHHGVEFSTGLRGLAEPPHCFGALRELIKALLARLGGAFPWLLEFSVREELNQLAEEFATCAARRCASLRKSVARKLFVAQIHSEVLCWILQSIESAIVDLECRFEDPRLLFRVRELRSIAGIVDVIEVLSRVPGQRPWLAKLHAENGPSLLLPMRPQEHFGGVLRAACFYYDFQHAQLFTTQDAEPLRVEQRACELEANGVLLYLLVRPYEPLAGSFDGAVAEIVKVLGTRFVLDRESRVLRLPRSLKDRTPEDMHDSLIMPASYLGPAQYYHLYDHQKRELISTRCSLSSLVEALREHCGADDGDFFCDSIDLEQVSSASLLQELEELRGEVTTWLWSKVGSHLYRPRRGCTAFFEVVKNVFPIKDLPLLQTSAYAQLEDECSNVRFVEGSSIQSCSTPRGGNSESGAATPSTRRPEESDDECDFVGAVGDSRIEHYSEFFGGNGQVLAWGNPREPVSAWTDDPISNVSEQIVQSVGRITSTVKRYLPPGFDHCRRQTSAEDDPDPPEGADKKKTADQLVHQQLGPEIVRPVVLSAVACTAPLLSFHPQAQFVMRDVIQVLGNSAVLVAPMWPATIYPGIASVTGAIGGSVVGSVMGPLGAATGAVLGGVVTETANQWMATRPEFLSLVGDSYTLSSSAVNGRMYLAHKEVPRKPTGAGMATALLAQATIKGCWNLWAYSQGEMSGRDVSLSLFKDVRDGAMMWVTCQGVLKVLTLGELRGAGLIHSLCKMAIINPSPIMFGTLGAGWSFVRYAQYKAGRLSYNQLESGNVLAAGATGIGIMTNLVGGAFHMSPLGVAILTCVMSQAAGLCIYEVWRTRRQVDAETRLRNIACDVLGLPPSYTREDLKKRWTILARFAHPDRNLKSDAKTIFEVFSLCRDALREDRNRNCFDHEQGLDCDRCSPSNGTSVHRCLFGLLERLQRIEWVPDQDLPYPQELADLGSRRRPDV